MKKNIIAIFGTAVVLVAGITSFSCSPASGSTSGGPVITALAAEHSAVYPVGNTRITCSATATDGDNLTYQWASNEGIITGTGQTITWEAPKTYGDYYVMCTVFDSHGNRASRTAKVTVIIRDPSQPGCCR